MLVHSDADAVGDVFSAGDVAISSTLSSSSTPVPSSSSSLPAARQLAPVCAVAVVKTTGDVSWSLAAMQAYQTLGCHAPGASGFGSTAFYGQSSSPYSTIPAGSYADGLLPCVFFCATLSLAAEYRNYNRGKTEAKAAENCPRVEAKTIWLILTWVIVRRVGM